MYLKYPYNIARYSTYSYNMLSRLVHRIEVVRNSHKIENLARLANWVKHVDTMLYYLSCIMYEYLKGNTCKVYLDNESLSS